MMVPHYILVGPVCCSGSSSTGQAFGVALVEQEAMVVVEQVVEAKEWEESFIGASTLDEVHSTKFVVKCENEMSEQLVEYSIEEDTTKEWVWTRKDE